MPFTSLMGGPGGGINVLRQEYAWPLNKTGAATVVGQLMQFDLRLTVATTYVEGSVVTATGVPNSAYNVVVNPSFAVATVGVPNPCQYAMYGIAQEVAADAKQVKVCIRGRTNALIRAVLNGKEGAGTPVLPPFTASNVQRYLSTLTQNNLKVLGWVEGAYTLAGIADALETAEGSYTAGAVVMWPILFNGIEGMA